MTQMTWDSFYKMRAALAQSASFEGAHQHIAGTGKYQS